MGKFISILLMSFAVGCTQLSPEARMEKDVAGINEKCPTMIDSETRLDGIDIVKPNTIIYKYTLVNLNVQYLDTQGFRSAMWPGILGTIKINPAMQKLRDNNTTIQYSYRDKDGRTAYIFTITPQHYK